MESYVDYILTTSILPKDRKDGNDFSRKVMQFTLYLMHAFDFFFNNGTFNFSILSYTIYIQGVPYTLLPFRTAGISSVLKLESRYFHIAFHTPIGFMC